MWYLELDEFIESGMVVTRGWGKGRTEELVFNEYGVSVLQEERTSGEAWADG